LSIQNINYYPLCNLKNISEKVTFNTRELCLAFSVDFKYIETKPCILNLKIIITNKLDPKMETLTKKTIRL